MINKFGGGTGNYARSSTTSEASIVNRIIKYLKLRGGWVLKTHGGLYQKSGLPDIMYLEAGCLYAFEVKLPGGDTTALQKLALELLDANGAVVGVVTSVPEVEEIFKAHS